jgi:hypothetical protein
MSDFFDSEIVKEEIATIGALQQRILQSTLAYPNYDYEQKKYHIQLLKDLFEKQKILYMRFSLSDDPDARSMIDRMKSVAVRMGIPANLTMLEIFEFLQNKIDNMEASLDKQR